jgi:hypothetical protein
MAAWRRKAPASFPILSRDLHDREYSYYQLYFALLPMVRDAHVVGDTATLQAIYEFAAWCLAQNRRAPDLNNAVAVAFYEHLSDNEADWACVLPWLTRTVTDECWGFWEYRRPHWEHRHGEKVAKQLWPAVRRRAAEVGSSHGI